MNQETINTVVSVVAIPLMVALVPMIVAALKAGTQKLKAQVKDQELHKYLDIAEDAVQTAVLSTYQTYVKHMKGTEDWNADAQQAAFQEAKMKALVIMGATAKTALSEVYTDFDQWLDNKIESYVLTST